MEFLPGMREKAAGREGKNMNMIIAGKASEVKKAYQKIDYFKNAFVIMLVLLFSFVCAKLITSIYKDVESKTIGMFLDMPARQRLRGHGGNPHNPVEENVLILLDKLDCFKRVTDRCL